MNTNRVVRVSFTLFICLITIKDAAKTPKTKSTDSAKQTGFLLYVSKLMAPKEVVPIKMESIPQNTLTYAKMRMLYYFQRLDHELFLGKKFSKTKILERVPSKGIRPSLQWQDIKSAWGLPVARSHLGLYVPKEKKWFGLYTRNFRSPLRRVKKAFFKVLNLYGERIQEHFTTKTHTINDVFDVKLNPESEKLLMLDKYNIYKETKELLDDLTPSKVFWSPGEMIIFNEFLNMYGKPPVEVPQEAGDWDEGWDEEEEKEKSSSGTDYFSDDWRFRLPPESDNSDISDKEQEQTAIEDQLEEKIQEIARKESETKPESIPRTETAPRPPTQPMARIGTAPIPAQRAEHETNRVGNPANSESETESSESDNEAARTHPQVAPTTTQQTGNPVSRVLQKSEESSTVNEGASTGISAGAHSLLTCPSDQISDDEMKGIREGPGEYLRTVSKLDSEITKIVCDPEQRKIIAESDPTLKTIPPQCEDHEKSKQHSHHQTTAHPSSNDASGKPTGRAGFSFFGGGFGRGALPPSAPRPDGISREGPPLPEVAKPPKSEEAGIKEAPPTAVTEPSHHQPSPTSPQHPTTDAVLDTPPEPKHEGEDDDEWTTDEESEGDEKSDKEHSHSQTQQPKIPETETIFKPESSPTAVPSVSATQEQPSGSQVPTSMPLRLFGLGGRNRKSNDGDSNPTATRSNLTPFQFETTEDLGDGRKMQIKTEGHWSIERKPGVADTKYNVHYTSNSVQQTVQPVSMADAKTVFENHPENNWWLSTADTKSKVTETPSENYWWLPSIPDWFA